MRKAARVISVLLHPLLMPLLAVWLCMMLDPHLAYFLGPTGRWFMLGMLALMTIAFPMTSILLLLRSGLIRDLELTDRRERAAPFTMTLMYYGMAYYLIRQTPVHPTMHALFFGCILALLLTTLITLRWKISAHMVGIGGVVGALTGIAIIHGLPLLPIIAVAILLSGVIATARLLSSDHDQLQILAGMVLGVSCTYGAIIGDWRM